MTSKLLLCGIIAFTTTLMLETHANAEGAVLVFGKVSPQQRKLIIDSVVGTAIEDGWAFRRNPADVATDVVIACLRADKPWRCVAPYLKDQSDQLLVVQVELERSDTVVTMHVLSAANENESTANHFCNVCDDTSLRRAVADVSKQLLRDAAERSGRTAISIRSKPEKAWITLDGKPAGVTNTKRATYPGEHTLMLRQLGYETSTRTVKLVEGKTLEVEVIMVPTGGTTPEPRTPKRPEDRPSRLASNVLLGAGAIAVIGGGVLIALDEDVTRAGKHEEHYFDSAPHGIAATIVGAAAIGTGLYLRLRSPKAASQNKTSSTSTPVLAPLPGGGVLGWSGSF